MPKVETIGTNESQIEVINPSKWTRILSEQGNFHVIFGDDNELPEGCTSAVIDMISSAEAGEREHKIFYSTVNFVLPEDGNECQGWQDNLIGDLIEKISEVAPRFSVHTPYGARHTFYVAIAEDYDAQVSIVEDREHFSMVLNTMPNPSAHNQAQPLRPAEQYKIFQDYLVLFNSILSSIKTIYNDQSTYVLPLNPNFFNDDDEEQEQEIPETQTSTRIENNEHQVSDQAPGLSSLGGLFEPKRQLKKLIQIIHNPELARQHGLSPRHFLLHGPTGTGKSSLVEAFAAEIGAELQMVSSTQLADMYVGNSGKNMQALFDEVKQHTEPFVLMFDEFDSLAPKGKLGTTERVDMKNVMKRELIELHKTHPHIIVAATTNSELSDFDSAMLRNGRLEPIYVGPPTEAERIDIWLTLLAQRQYHTGPDTAEMDDNRLGIDVFSLAKQTPDLTGSHIHAILEIVDFTLFSQALAGDRTLPVTQSDIERAIKEHRLL